MFQYCATMTLNCEKLPAEPECLVESKRGFVEEFSNLWDLRHPRCRVPLKPGRPQKLHHRIQFWSQKIMGVKMGHHTVRPWTRILSSGVEQRDGSMNCSERPEPECCRMRGLAAVTPLELPEVPRTRLHKAHRPTKSTVCQRGTSNALTSQMRGVKNDFQKSILSLSIHPS